MPDSYPTAFNFKSILGEKSIVAILALAVLIPLSAGHYDLSVGSLIGISHILAIGLQVNGALPWWAAVGCAVLATTLIGLISGLIITRLGVGSFIATLGMSTIVYGLGLWYTGGEQLTGRLDPVYLTVAQQAFGIPTAAWITLFISFILWIVYTYMPLGRFFRVVGDNPRAAELVGIPVARYVLLSFVLSGFLAGTAGVILAAKYQVAQSAVGPEFLLPAFAAVLFGATSVEPGRPNVWGTLLAVLVLAAAVSGLQQLGAKAYVEPLFNGGMLIIAVSVATLLSSRRKS